jgi:uncharacterized protein GlcG (DUF336 family)
MIRQFIHLATACAMGLAVANAAHGQTAARQGLTLDGAKTIAAAVVAIEKARTAATFRKPTRDFENAIAKGRTALVAVDVMTPLQGGVPIVVDGVVVGAIGVSGAMTAQQDDDIATRAAGVIAGPASTAGNLP